MSIKKNNASSNIVYKGLRDDILSLKLIPGSAISETDIASKYNVSRTPVRDAFKALSNEGLLEVKPHVGTFVSLMDINQISDVLYVRKVVELSILKDLANSLTEADELRLKFNLNEQKIFLLNTADSEDSVNDFQNHAAAKALPHPLFLPCALVLRHQRRHRMRDILLRRVGKIINPVDHGKRSRHWDSHRIDDRLNADLSKLYRRLLHR